MKGLKEVAKKETFSLPVCYEQLKLVSTGCLCFSVATITINSIIRNKKIK